MTLYYLKQDDAVFDPCSRMCGCGSHCCAFALQLLCPKMTYESFVKMTIMSDVSNPRGLQPGHQFRQAFPNEKGDDGWSGDELFPDSDKDSDAAMMGSDNDEPTPIHESTRIGQTDTSYSFQLSDDDSSIRQGDASNQKKSKRGKKSTQQPTEGMDASTSKASDKEKSAKEKKSTQQPPEDMDASTSKASDKGKSEKGKKSTQQAPEDMKASTSKASDKADESNQEKSNPDASWKFPNFRERRPRSRKSSVRSQDDSLQSSPPSTASSSRRPSRSRSGSRRRSSTHSQDSLADAFASKWIVILNLYVFPQTMLT